VNVLEIVLIVFALLVLGLGIGGFMAMSRRTASREDKLLEQLKQAERELAKAHAADKGWDPATLQSAARAAADQRFGASDVNGLQLVQVIDKPGTDADQAVFRVETAQGERSLTLGRTGGVWGPAA
jgi:type II secretory pathway pseudopilin PulG